MDDEARAEDEDLMLAALYCRMCIECLCYRRLELYKNKNPGSDFSDWRPAKVLKFLIKEAPFSDSSARISSKSAGLDIYFKPFDARKVNRHYHWLGKKFLHMPQRGTFPADTKRIIKRLRLLIGHLDEAFSHQIEHMSVLIKESFPCVKCRGEVDFLRRLPGMQQDAFCESCKVKYCIGFLKSGEVELVIIDSVKFACATTGCSGRVLVWNDEAILSKHWICSRCHVQHRFSAYLAPELKKGGP